MKFLILASHARSLIGFRKPLIQALVDSGLKVHAAAPDLLSVENQRVVEQLSVMGVSCHDAPLSRTGMNPVSDIKAMFALRGLMKVIQPDYFLGYTIKPVIYGNLAAWLARVPRRFALITGLGYAFVDDDNVKRKLINKVVIQLYRSALGKCEAVFFQNTDDQELFLEQKILASSATSYVVNGSGVPTDEYVYQPAIVGEGIKFFLMARLVAAKGIRIYAEAAKQVKAIYPNISFMLAGGLHANDGIRKDELDTWIEQGNIDYLGRLSDVSKALGECSVFVLPTYYREGVPRSILEAMSTGRAIITTDAPGCRETVVDGDNGFLVPIKNVEAVVDAMTKFIEAPELIHKMGKRSREIAEQKYDVEIVNQQMLEGMGL